MSLNNKNWKEFYIKDVFNIENKTNIQTPTGAYINKDNLQNGITPRITVTSQNNGIDGYYNSDHNNYRIHKNFISVSFLGTVFYHQYKASIDMKVHCLQIKNIDLNLYLGIFLTTEIKKSISNASYGNQMSSTDLPNRKIILPINSKKQPDWQFMEEYAKGIYNKKQQEYKTYIEKSLSKLEQKSEFLAGGGEWKEFLITDIFSNIQRGKRLTKSKQKIGKKPYVSSTALSNGVDNFISNKDSVRTFSNCLTIANSGSVGISFYHPYEFIASDHITHLKQDGLNKFSYIFIASLTNRFSQKYNFNREINDNRISREKILLPVNNKNQPDYLYMEQYIKNIMYKKYNKYLQHLTQ